MDSSFYLTLLDEISLEGLDGITFPSLWIRLHERDKYLIKCGKKPLFQFESEASLCETIFKILVKDVEKGHVGFYEFPTPRRKVFVFDRNKYFQSESGCFCFDNSAVPDDFQAPIVIIKQENPDIMGSCEDFDKRKDISQKIVSDVKNKKLKCYEDFQKSYKIDHVVIVASQNLRNQALLGHDRSWDVDLEIRPEHYVILESIGRKRWTGEMLFGKEAPIFKDAKIKSSYHYWRKYLSQHRLVFSITTSLHAKGRRQNFLTTIAYLPRFRPKILHPNDWKIVELSTIFIEKCQNKLSLEDLRQEFEKIQVTKPLTMKKIRSFLVRYQHIIKMHEDDKKSGVFLEYLRPLDQTLDYEDIYENRGSSLQSADETEQQVTAKPNKSGKKCPEISAETDADFEDEMIDDDPNSNVKEVDREDCDEFYSDDDDDDFISMNVGHSIDKTEWGDPETELENIDQSMDHDFDCEEFFNSESNFQIPLLEKARNQSGTDSKLASSSDNNGECKEVSVVPARQLIKFEILDRKLQKELRNLPRNKFICLQDGQILKISLLKIQQIHRNIKSKFIWLIKQIGPISRVRMISWFDLSNNILRSLIKQFENIGQITHTVELRGRQSIFKYHTKCSNTTVQMDPDKQTDVIKTRINHVLETFQHQLYFDCFFILKWYIAQRETELGFLIDVRSIIRILNHLAESEKIKLYQYCFAYGSYVRVSHFMILRLEDQELMEQIHQHMIMRTLFDSYGRFPIDLKKDVRIESCLDEDGKISRKTLSEIKDDFKETNKDSWEETKNFDDFRESIPAYRPSLAMHLYGCGRSSKLEKMFELYRFLFYLLVGDSDQSSSRPWLNRLPKFLSKFPNNGQFSQADFLPYMPLTVLRNCLSIRHEVPGLEVLLDDPVQQNLMLHEMPPKIRSQLFFSRKLHLDLRDVLTSLTYFRLLDHQHNFKFREYQKFQYKLNTKIELKQGASETVQFIFNNVADFDQFTQLVYNHLLEFRTECTDCPFDNRLNLHLINLNSRFFKKLSRKNPPEEDETQSLPKNKKHRAKRKPQQLKQTKNKRIKLEMKNRKNHHHPVNKAKTSSKKWTKKRKGISRRVRWSKNEDQFLLKCRLLSVLFGVSPGSKFAVPLNFISDLLRRNLGPKSSDKNPSTCARRILSMMKKPPIKRVLRVCLLELKREFPDPLNEENWDRDSPEQMKKFEKYLQQLLAYRFVNTEFFMTKQELMDNVLKLDSDQKSANQNVDMETLLSMNEIINPYVEEICGYYMDPKNYYDIHSYVITNVLMSALISFHLHSDPEQTEETTKLRRCFMRTIFKTLKHFPDNLVLLVIKRLIKFRFITHKKKNNKDEKKLHPYAYKLGAVFFNDLAQHNLTYDLKYKQQVVRIKEENVCETMIEVDNSLIGAMEFGENLCVNILGLNKNTEDMNMMEKINGLNPDEPLLYPATMLDEIDFPIEIPNNFICLSKDVLETNRKKCRGLLMNRNSQLGDLLIEENLDRSKTKTPLIDNMSVIHCKVRIKQQVRLGRPIFSQRFFNLFAIHLQSFCTEEIVSESEENTNQPQKIFTPEIFAELTQEFSKNIAIPFNVEKKFPDLIEFIQSKKELGATMDMLLDYLLQPLQEIDRQSMANSLEEFLLFSCQKIKLIFRVGIITKLWVHKQYIRFWLVHSFKNLDLDEDHLSTLDKSSFKRIKKIYFLPKLWKSPDGQIDLKILFLFLNRLIAFLTTESGVATCLNRIQNNFQQFLPKVQLEELLELLLAIDCVRITNKTDDIDLATEDSTPCSINSFDDFFRNPCHSSSGDNRGVRKPVASKNPSSDFLYEANVDAYSRLASLHKILAKLYDF